MNKHSTAYVGLAKSTLQSSFLHSVSLLSWKSGWVVATVLFSCMCTALPELHAQSKKQIFEALPGVGTISVGNTMLFEMTADSSQPELRVGFFAGGQSSSAVVRNLEAEINPTPRGGFHVGARLEMEFADPLFLLVEFEYARKGINSSFKSANGITRNETYKFDYLDVPILFRGEIQLDEKTKLAAGLGTHVSLLLSSTRVTRIAEAESQENLDDGLENFDFGIEGRAGFIYNLLPRWDLTADLRYLHGLQNIIILSVDTRDRSWNSRSFLVSAGVSYQLQRSIR